MKNFEHKPKRLTEEQGKKIEEMAVMLFPEYNKVILEQYDADNLFVIMTTVEEHLFKPGLMSYGGHRYHWFEFMFFASKRVSEMLKINNLFEMHVTNNKKDLHLVDFMYEKFKIA